MDFNHSIKSAIETVCELSVGERSHKSFSDLTSAFRCLRNSCAEGCHVQDEIVADDRILHSTHIILNDIYNLGNTNEEANLCLLVGLQFIANLLVNNRGVQPRVWEMYEDLLDSCLNVDNPKLQNCAAMIFYNIILNHPNLNLKRKTFERLVSLTTDSKTSEFPLYLLQYLISKTTYLVNCYDSLTHESKKIMIEIMQDHVTNEAGTLHTDLINFFVKKFENYSDKILNMLDDVDSPSRAYEIAKILELLSSLSGSQEDTQLPLLQSHKSLLVDCVMLLKSVHALSKQSNNNFTMIQKLSELDEIENNSTVQEHPYFGFKTSLIRLIGNLCWKNSDNQNQFRDLDGIPILLDCCNIDGRNPFILQWAIFAIRNICDCNEENQKYIAALPRNGTIDVEKLNKMGILLNKESDGSSLSICPIDIKK